MKSATFTFVLSMLLSLPTFLATSLSCLAQERVDPVARLIEVKHSVRGGQDQRYLGEGDVLNLQVRAIGAVAVYVYVIYQDATGDSFLLFPNAAEPNNLVNAGQDRTVPGRDSRLRFGVVKPFGNERLEVFASAHPLPEITRQFQEARPAEELDKLLKWIATQENVEAQVSEFETRARRSVSATSEPELVR